MASEDPCLCLCACICALNHKSSFLIRCLAHWMVQVSIVQHVCMQCIGLKGCIIRLVNSVNPVQVEACKCLVHIRAGAAAAA